MHIVSASRDKTIKVWNFDGNKNECVLGARRGKVIQSRSSA